MTIYSFSVLGSVFAPGSALASMRPIGIESLSWLHAELVSTVPTTGIANLAILAAVLWCLHRGRRSARREARGHAMSIQRFCSLPTLALAASILALLGPIDRSHNVALWVMAFAGGLALGIARGVFVVVQVDRQRRLIRVMRAEDGLLAMRFLLSFGALELLAILMLPWYSFWYPLLAACTALCAAFLVGRFASVWLRARAECHMDLANTVRAGAEAEVPMIEQSVPAWSSRTARLVPGFTPIVPVGWRKLESEEGDAEASIVPDTSAPPRRDARGRFVPASSRGDTASP